MTAQDCLQILREVKDAAFATVDENGYPQVRIIDVMLVEDGTIYFCTARGKDFYQQLARTGRAAVTALNKDYQMVRLSGKVKRLTEQYLGYHNPSFQPLKRTIPIFCSFLNRTKFKLN